MSTLVKVYFDTVSYWHLYNADLAFLPKHIWEDVEDYKSFGALARTPSDHGRLYLS